MDERFVREKAGIVDQKLGRKIIHAVDDDVIIVEDFERVAGGEALFVH